MGLVCCKDKGKRYRTSKERSKLSEQDGNAHEEQGGHPGGNTKKKKGRHTGVNTKKEQKSQTGRKKRKKQVRQLGENKYEEQKSSAAYQGEISHHQPQTDQDQQIKRYEEELKRKTEKIKQLEAEKSDLIFRFQTDQDQKIKTYEEERTRKVERIQHLEAEKSDLINRRDKQNSKIRTYEEELKIKTEKMKQLEAEKNDLLTRLSSEAAIKMTYNNPNITNLSDQDRPTKVSERYGELYDNQWTDAFENLQTKHNMSDTTAIEVLLDILYVSFEKCKEVRKQREDLENCITKYVGAAAGDLTVLEVMSTLKDASKMNLAKILQEYTKIVLEALQEKYHKELQSVSHYLDECVEICLLMNLHNPALELTGFLVKKDQPFDLTLFRSYTKSGNIIAYMVWPALQLHKGGPLLCKGVAQGTSDSAKGHTDHAIKEKHESKVSDRQDPNFELTIDRGQTSNRNRSKETVKSFAEKEVVQVSLNSRDTGNEIKSMQSQKTINTKRQRGYENLNCSSDIVTSNEKGTKQNKEEAKGTNVTILTITQF